VIQEISSFAELCALKQEWADLWVRSPGATPFQSPEWLLPWWTHLFGGGEMWTIAVRENAVRENAVRENGRLIGLAPMFMYGGRRVALIG